jgi:hypothetical protein
MPNNPLLLTLTALSLGMQLSAGQAQTLSAAEIQSCRQLLEAIGGDEGERARCIALLGQLNILPAGAAANEAGGGNSNEPSG